MKTTPLFSLFLICVSTAVAQPDLSISPTSADEWSIDWFGENGTIYFFQHSSDLQIWEYDPRVKTGTNTPTNLVFESTEVRHFWRMISTTDYVTPYDIDGDGLPNELEISPAIMSDPFNADTNGDGLLDGPAWEAALPVTGEDTDGLSASYEASIHTFPWLNDSDGDGIIDGLDSYPLDSSRSSLPAPSGNSAQVDLFLDVPSDAVQL